jgi:cytidine deaminase
VNDRNLIEEADRARARAYVPYSGISVGASVETNNGEVFSACNVENASYGLTICAERAAVSAAVAAGHTKITKVAIVAENLEEPVPCGACLQVMSEFNVKRVIVGKPDGSFEAYELRELLPRPFKL